MKKGLILEGGAMRGLFTAGVCDVFMENGIEFDGAVGVSAGAAFGCNLKSRQTGRALRYNLRFCRDKRYCSFRSLIKTGDLFGADFCYREIPQKLDVFDIETFSKNPMEFYVVCTDIETGKPFYKKCETGGEEDLSYIQASASMPLAARIVEADGKKLLDGGVSDSVPLKFFEELGYEKNVVILTQPSGYIKGKNKALPLLKRKYKAYPNLIETMKNRHIIYNETSEYINRKEAEGEVFVIRPPEALPVGRIEHNPEKLKSAYNIGRTEAEKRLGELLKFLRD